MFTADDIFHRIFTDWEPWRDQAACRNHPDADMFFEDTARHGYHDRDTHARRRTDQAIAICHTCPVRHECLEHALANNERWGVWGSKTAQERRVLARRRRINRQGAA
jgi:WhiB family redox-sensing transcriptional regulator